VEAYQKIEVARWVFIRVFGGVWPAIEHQDGVRASSKNTAFLLVRRVFERTLGYVLHLKYHLLEGWTEGKRGTTDGA
jgi:hypothetical protein